MCNDVYRLAVIIFEILGCTTAALNVIDGKSLTENYKISDF